MSPDDHSEENLAELLERLAPPPEAWVRTAQELPLVHGRLDELVARAFADEAYRREVTDDFEAALFAAGLEPEPSLVRVLRKRLEAG